MSVEELNLIQRAADHKDAHPSSVAREVLVRWAKRVLAL